MSRTLSRVASLSALVAILVAGALLRAGWRDQLVDRGIGGDGLHYWNLAVHLDGEHALSLDGRTPEWTRLPGYSAFLALTTSPAVSQVGAMDPLSIKVRVDAWLRRLTRANLAADLLCGLGAFLLALALGAGGYSLLAAAAWAAQPWSSVIAMHPLSDDFSALLTVLAFAMLARAMRTGRARDFAFAGVMGGLGQYVRTDALFLLPACVAGALLCAGTRRHRARLALAALLAYTLVYAPWPVRNLVVFGEPHLLGGGAGIDQLGRPLDREPVFAWMRTWSTASEAASLRVAWPFPSQPLSLADVPPEATDSPAERDALGRILAGYARKGARLDGPLSDELYALARAHRRRHPFDYFVRLPLTRMARRLFPPRDGFGMGTLPTLERSRAAWCVADGAVMVLGLAGLGALLLRRRTRPVALVLSAWLAIRLAMMAALPAPEPRYFLEALPPLYATFAALLPSLLLRARERSSAGARSGDAPSSAGEAATVSR